MIQETSPPTTDNDDQLLHNDAISSSHCLVTDLHPPSELGSLRSSVLDTPPQSTDILKDIAASHSNTDFTSSNMPLYAIPDKVKAKVSQYRKIVYNILGYTRIKIFHLLFFSAHLKGIKLHALQEKKWSVVNIYRLLLRTKRFVNLHIVIQNFNVLRWKVNPM